MDRDFRDDVAEDSDKDRWIRAEWRTFELWEKVEQRFRRSRRLWVVSALIAFLLVSAIPVLMDRWPKWTGMAAARKLAEKVSDLKVRAALDHADFRIRFEPGTVNYRIERVESCASPAGNVIEEGSLVEGARAKAFVLVDEASASQWEIPGLVTSLCYSSLGGIEFPIAEKELAGLLVSPAEDVELGRMDRSSFLLISGRSGEIISD